MCDVCKAELGMQSSVILEDDDLELEEELTKLCPICKRVYINVEDEMCDTCAAAKDNRDPLDENDDEWRNYLDDDPDEYESDKIEIPLEELQGEEEAEDEEEEEEESEPIDEVDDFDFYDDDEEFDDDDDEDDESDDDDDYDK